MIHLFRTSSTSKTSVSALSLEPFDGAAKLEDIKRKEAAGERYKDVEKGNPAVLEALKIISGYPSIGARMATVPHLAMFRSFSALSNQSLLYMQAELVALERQLRTLEVEDSRSGNAHEKKFASDFEWLALEEGALQYQTVLRIQEKIKAYREMVQSRTQAT